MHDILVKKTCLAYGILVVRRQEFSFALSDARNNKSTTNSQHTCVVIIMVYALTVIIELTSLEQLPRLVAAFRGLHASSNDPSRDSGCLSYELVRSNDDEKTVMILERFVDQAAHKITHRGTPAFAAFSAWLRGEAMKDDLPGGRIVQSVKGSHWCSGSRPCVNGADQPVVIPKELQELARVERLIRTESKRQQQADDGGAAVSPSDPIKFAYEPITNGVLVFGGARAGAKEDYMKVSAAVGAAIARSGRPLIYGAGTVGCMGAAAKAAMDEPNTKHQPVVVGVIPEALFPRELSGECIGQVCVTQDMNERKRLMFAASSMIISLPGGVGTLDELLEAITLFQLNCIRHKILLVNVCGFYEPLVALLRSQVEAGFVNDDVFNYFELYNGDGSDVMSKLESMKLSAPAAPLNWKRDD